MPDLGLSLLGSLHTIKLTKLLTSKRKNETKTLVVFSTCSCPNEDYQAQACFCEWHTLVIKWTIFRMSGFMGSLGGHQGRNQDLNLRGPTILYLNFFRNWYVNTRGWQRCIISIGSRIICIFSYKKNQMLQQNKIKVILIIGIYNQQFCSSTDTSQCAQQRCAGFKSPIFLL